MTARLVLRLLTGFYLVLFFGYLFGPLAVMGISAFNTPTYPTAIPFEGLPCDGSPHWQLTRT